MATITIAFVFRNDLTRAKAFLLTSEVQEIMIEQNYLSLTLLLPQPQQLTFPVGLALGVLLGGLITEYYGHIRKTKENRIKVYSRLKGEKSVLSQLYKGVSSYAVRIEYRRALKYYLMEMIESKCRDRPDIKKEIKREMERFEIEKQKLIESHDKAVTDLAKAEEKWYRDIGSAEIRFNNPRLLNLAKEVEDSEKAIVTFMDNLKAENVDIEKGLSITAVDIKIDEKWQIEKEAYANELIDDYDKKINNLLDLLKSNI
jgi:hypothetical protein